MTMLSIRASWERGIRRFPRQAWGTLPDGSPVWFSANGSDVETAVPMAISPAASLPGQILAGVDGELVPTRGGWRPKPGRTWEERLLHCFPVLAEATPPPPRKLLGRGMRRRETDPERFAEQYPTLWLAVDGLNHHYRVPGFEIIEWIDEIESAYQWTLTLQVRVREMREVVATAVAFQNGNIPANDRLLMEARERETLETELYLQWTGRKPAREEE